MNYLAIDLGDKRTGIAVGNDRLGLAHPLCVLEKPIGPQLLEGLQEIISKHCPDAIVMGLPLNMDGSEGKRSQKTREFGDKIKALIPLPLHYQDERLSSAAAEEYLNQSGKTHKQKKKTRDALAATEILKDFIKLNQSSS